MAPLSFRLDIVFAGDGTPCLHLLAEEAAKLVGPPERERDLLSLCELRGDALLTHASRKVTAEPAHDRLRRAGRRKHAPPRKRLEAGKTALGDGWDRAQRRGARFAGLGDRPDRPGLDLRDRKRGAADEKIDMSGNGV